MTSAIRRRDEFLKIRLTTGERIDLDEAAVRLGKSVSEFVRDTALHQAGIVKSVDAGKEPQPQRGILISAVEYERYQQFKLAEFERIRKRVRVY